MKAIILAAGSGKRIKIHKPKGFINIAGKYLIDYSIDNLLKIGVSEIIIVTGYYNEMYKNYFNSNEKVRLIFNPEYSSSGSLHSLYLALKDIDKDEDLVILDSDILYNWNEFENFINSNYTNSILATNVNDDRNDACYIETDISDNLIKISKNINCVSFDGNPWEYIGITKTSKDSIQMLIDYTEDKYKITGNIDHEYDYAFESIDLKYKVLRYPDYIWSEADDNFQLQYMINIVYPKITLC